MQQSNARSSKNQAINNEAIGGGGGSRQEREPRMLARDPLRKLGSLFRNNFLAALLVGGPSSQVATGSSALGASTYAEQTVGSAEAASGRALSAERPQQEVKRKQNANKTEGGSRSCSQLEPGGDDDEYNQQCCLPLSHLIVQQQQQQQEQPRAVSEPTRGPLSHLVGLIREGSTNCEYGPGVYRQSTASDNWLDDLQQSTLEPKTNEPQPVQQQPKSREKPPVAAVQPHLMANKLLLEANIQTAQIGQLNKGGSASKRRALSKGSSRTGSRWSSGSGGGGEQKHDRMGELIALLNQQDIRRTSSYQQQQSSVMGSQIISDSSCDILPATTTNQVAPPPSNFGNGKSMPDGDSNDDVFQLEESWQSFVNLTPSSGSTTGNNNRPSMLSDEENEEDEGDENQRCAYLDQPQYGANLKIQQDAIWELLTTEVFYIKRIKVIIDLFLATLVHLQQHSLLREIDANRVFSNIVEIYDANYTFWINHLYPMLARARSTHQPMDPAKMRNAFVQIGNIFSPYYRYCLDHKACLSYFKEQNRTNNYFKIYVVWCESQKDCERLRLMDLLAKPMQRLTRYSLLLKAINKKTDNQADLKALEQMIAHMNRFVLTVDLELRRQEELELLMSTARRIGDSIETGTADVYNDEIDKLLRSHYGRFDLAAPLFNCPFKCHRQLLYDSTQPLGRGHLHLGQIRFKDTKTSGKLEVVVLVFTDHLFICRPQSSGGGGAASAGQAWPSKRRHTGAYFTGSSGSGQVAGASPGGGGGGNANRSPSGAGGTQRSLCGSGLLLGYQPLASSSAAAAAAAAAAGGATTSSSDEPSPLLAHQQQHQQLGQPRPRAGSHQAGGSTQPSLRVYHPYGAHQLQVTGQQLSPRAYSLILSPDVTDDGVGGQVGAGQEAATAAIQPNDNCCGRLSPTGRACSQTCVSLSSSPKFHQLHLGRHKQPLSAAQSQLKTTFALSTSQASSRKSSTGTGTGTQSQRPSFHASSSSLMGTMAREFFRRSAESSRSGDNYNYHAHLTTTPTVAETSGQPHQTTGGSFHRYNTAPPQLGAEGGGGHHSARLRVIRTPYPIERLVMHELKGGQGVFFCQLNDSMLVASSFVLYCSSTSSSPSSSSSAAAAAAVKRSSSDQQASAVSNAGRVAAATGSQHLKLANSNQQDSSSRSDSESQQSGGQTATKRGDEASKCPSRQQQLAPAQHLINLVKQAQGRYKLAADYHEVSIVDFGSHLDSIENHGKDDNDVESRRAGKTLNQRPATTKSKLSTWSYSLRQTRSRNEAGNKTAKLDNLRMDANTIHAPAEGGVEINDNHNHNHRGERAKLERRSASSDYGQQQLAQDSPERKSSGQQWVQQPQRTRLTSPMSKALFEQRQSMLLNHGELESQTVQWSPKSLEFGAEVEAEEQEQVSLLNAVPEHECYEGSSGGPSVSGSDCGGGGGAGMGGVGGDADVSRAGSQSSVFDEISSGNGGGGQPNQQQQQQQNHRMGATLRAPTERHRRSFSSPTSPKNARHHLGDNRKLREPAHKSAINSPGTSFTSSDSEYSSTRSSSPFVGQIGRQRHTESTSLWPVATPTNSNNGGTSFIRSYPVTVSRIPPYHPLMVQQSSTEQSELSNSIGDATGVTGSAGDDHHRQARNSRRHLSSLRRQNVILSASSDQQQQQQQQICQDLNLNNRRQSDLAVQRQQQLAATNSWISGHVSGSRDFSYMMSTDTANGAQQQASTTNHLTAPSSMRHRQFVAHHHHHHQANQADNSNSQATTVDQTNSAIFDSADQPDVTLPPVQQQQQSYQPNQLNASQNQASCSSSSFELGHLGSQKFQVDHNHHPRHHSSAHRQQRNSCSCADHTRSASVETRSPISVTLTLPNNAYNPINL